jgi:hypothetical protein
MPFLGSWTLPGFAVFLRGLLPLPPALPRLLALGAAACFACFLVNARHAWAWRDLSSQPSCSSSTPMHENGVECG